jgi:lipopolysaccharide transport system ATP-binding protein
MSSQGEVLVHAEGVSKKFCRSLKRSLWYGVQDVAAAIIPWAKSSEASIHWADDTQVPPLRRDEFWALHDVSFDVCRGECLGLIGHNGAGKSTLLKILNGLITPDAGRVTMRGRVGALIELNAGFNPILSGRENVYTEASLLGFNKTEIKSRFDAIVEFADLHEFIDMPVQNYSSGMRVRLGFAIAAQMEPDILLIDEVLAVGDVGFRAKCLTRMGELREKCAFIFVSHSMPQVARISTGILHLDHGKRVIMTRRLSDAIDSYYSGFETVGRTVSGTGDVLLESIKARVNGGEIVTAPVVPIVYGDYIDFEIDCSFSGEIQEATIQLVFWSQEMIPVVDVLDLQRRQFPIRPGADGHSRVKARVKDINLNSGRFGVSVVVLTSDGLTTLCQVDRALELDVTSNFGSACNITVRGDWAVV